jgi:hypothetical protein
LLEVPDPEGMTAFVWDSSSNPQGQATKKAREALKDRGLNAALFYFLNPCSLITWADISFPKRAC